MILSFTIFIQSITKVNATIDLGDVQNFDLLCTHTRIDWNYFNLSQLSKESYLFPVFPVNEELVSGRIFEKSLSIEREFARFISRLNPTLKKSYSGIFNGIIRR